MRKKDNAILVKLSNLVWSLKVELKKRVRLISVILLALSKLKGL